MLKIVFLPWTGRQIANDRVRLGMITLLGGSVDHDLIRCHLSRGRVETMFEIRSFAERPHDKTRLMKRDGSEGQGVVQDAAQ